MLNKKNRLAKDTEIAQAFARGRSFFNPFFTVKYLRSEKKQFTVVVSTKVFKRAVLRNRLKRVIREHIRKHLNSFKPGSYIIIAKPKISTLPEASTLAAFKEICLKIK